MRLSVYTTLLFLTSVGATLNGGPILRKNQPQTNAQRFARGLPPLPPRNLFSPTRFEARDPAPSPSGCGPNAFYLKCVSDDGLLNIYFDAFGNSASMANAACWTVLSHDRSTAFNLAEIVAVTPSSYNGGTVYWQWAIGAPTDVTGDWTPADTSSVGAIELYDQVPESYGSVDFHIFDTGGNDYESGPLAFIWTNADYSLYPATMFYVVRSDGSGVDLDITLDAATVPAGHAVTFVRA